jgi:y4mF family transcriptional regulator
MKSLQTFLKEQRKRTGLTQADFADRAGVALTVIRKIEQGKGNLQLEKVNHILSFPRPLKISSQITLYNHEKSGNMVP